MISLSFAQSRLKKGNDAKKSRFGIFQNGFMSIDKSLSILSQLKTVDSI